MKKLPNVAKQENFSQEAPPPPPPPPKDQLIVIFCGKTTCMVEKHMGFNMVVLKAKPRIRRIKNRSLWQLGILSLCNHFLILFDGV